MVWPLENELNLSLNDLVQLKLDRDKARQSYNTIYRSLQSNGHTYSVMGNPNLGEVRGILMAIENSSNIQNMNAEVWLNELRLSNLDERGSWAALGRMDVVLADFYTDWRIDVEPSDDVVDLGYWCVVLGAGAFVGDECGG